MDSPRAPEFDRLLAAIAREFEGRAIPFMIIGGQAVLLHGEPRLTQDIDVTLGVGPDSIATVLDAVDSLGLQPLPDDPTSFARQHYVLPVAESQTRVRVDLIFSTTPYERAAIERAVVVQIVGAPVCFATAEDLILHKLFAGRPRDLEDARGVINRQGEKLDWRYLEKWAEQFSQVEGKAELPRLLEALRAEE
jgi:hypothetical protein